MMSWRCPNLSSGLNNSAVELSKADKAAEAGAAVVAEKAAGDHLHVRKFDGESLSGRIL